MNTSIQLKYKNKIKTDNNNEEKVKNTIYNKIFYRIQRIILQLIQILIIKI